MLTDSIYPFRKNVQNHLALAEFPNFGYFLLKNQRTHSMLAGIITFISRSHLPTDVSSPPYIHHNCQDSIHEWFLKIGKRPVLLGEMADSRSELGKVQVEHEPPSVRKQGST